MKRPYSVYDRRMNVSRTLEEIYLQGKSEVLLMKAVLAIFIMPVFQGFVSEVIPIRNDIRT
jgi:hypothetical protein